MISPPLLAVIAALAYALNNFFSRLGLEGSSPAVGVSVIATTNALFLWGLALLFSPIQPIFSAHIWPFLLAGVFAPSLARNLLMLGYRRIGMARSDVIAGAMPLFAVLLAVMTFGERPSALAVVGTIGIVAGIALLTHRREAGKGWGSRAILYPLGAAFFFAARDIAGKFGLQFIPLPLATAAVTASVAGVALNLPYLLPKVRKRAVLPGKSLCFFCLSGTLLSMAYMTSFMALKGGEVSQVAPLIGLFPLFSVALSFLFLQSKENVTWKVGAGGIIVVAGASCIWMS